MSLNTNLMALKTANTLNGHYNRLAASVQRLSTGLRVNSAADDAAGLAIRELMRADVAALQQGVRNANDAISLIQVADGALGVIDEKLIRMKELAEQAATGTYDSTQRLMIASEFQAMGAEIDRIARATDFNGIRLLDGSLHGAHDGSGLEAAGKLKIHFDSGNDSAEDYYYLEIGDCTTKGLGLWRDMNSGSSITGYNKFTGENRYEDLGFGPPLSELNNFTTYKTVITGTDPVSIYDLKISEGEWYCGCITATEGNANAMFIIPKGTKFFVMNQIGATENSTADNDIQLFTKNGVHLAGRNPVPDYKSGSLTTYCEKMGFTMAQYDNSNVNQGTSGYDKGTTLDFTTYNEMNIGFSGDGPTFDDICRYELLTIDQVTEDLVVWLPGTAGAVFKYYADFSDVKGNDGHQGTPPPGGEQAAGLIHIRTQEQAQKALETIDQAIVSKDKIRAHLGAMQNRLENTVTNISIQGENLQAAESRISDTDLATEMTLFVRNQVLTQAAVAMLGQANTCPRMLMNLLA